MSIVIPEKIIKEELEVWIKYIYNDLIAKRGIFAVNDAVDVDAGVTINTIVQSTATSPEKTNITFPSGANIDGTHWFISSPSKDYFVWYNTGASIQPLVPQRDAIKVDVLVTDTPDLIAVKTKDALDNVRQKGERVFIPKVVIATPDTIDVTCKEINAERTSILWDMFGGLDFDRFNYFSQLALILINRYSNEKRKLTISLGWTQNRETFPHISILLPSEEDSPKNVGLVQGGANRFNTTGSYEKEMAYQSTYSLFITSDNQNDVIVLYHFLKTIIMVGYEQFSLLGLQNMYVSGRDITMDFDLDPMNLYHRTVALTFHYENIVPNFIANASTLNATFNQP